jgi:NADH-quinone oxidoreductase subunit F
VGIGAQEPVRLNIPGEKHKDVVDGLKFLKDFNRTGKGIVGKKVAVIGGGNAAIDAARTAMRLGAETVTIIYRRTREDMPAWPEEIEAALNEGIRLALLTAPIAIKTKKDAIAGVMCKPMELDIFDSSGRRKPISKSDDTFLIEADQVIAAVGQKVDTSLVKNSVSPVITDWGTIAVNRANGQTSVPWLFSGGDAVSGPASVIEAVAAGERAAAGIDTFLTGQNHAFWRQEQTVATAFDPDAEPVAYGRTKQPELSVPKRKNNFDEIEQSLSESAAIKQAKRCLRCDFGKKTSFERR